MSLLRKCCLILGLMFAFEFGILIGVAYLVYMAEEELAKLAYSQELAANVQQLRSLLNQATSSIVIASLKASPSAFRTEEDLCNRSIKRIQDLTKSKYATNADRGEAKYAIACAKYYLEEAEQATEEMNSGMDPVQYFILLERGRKEIAPTCIKLHREAYKLLDRQLKLRSVRFNKLQERKNVIATATGSALCINVLIAGLLVFGFTRNVTLRLARVQDNFLRFNADAPLHEIDSGSDEIHQLDRNFHSFARALREAWKKDEAVFENMPLGLAVCSSDGMIEHVNPRAADYFDKSLDRLIDSSIFSLDKSGTLSQVWAAEHEEEQTRLVDFARGDVSFPAEVVLTRYVDHEGGRVLVAIVDVSEWEKLEQFKQQLLSMISHDLRTPLTTLAMKAAIVEESLNRDRFDLALKPVATMKSEIDRLNRLTGDLLEMARLGAGKVSCKNEIVRPADLIEMVLNAVSETASAKEICLPANPVAPNLVIETDVDRAAQILINFLSNAMKFSPEGADIILGAEVFEDRLRFFVQDQGRGIPEDKLQTIFQPFEQVSKADKAIGTGLGLSICTLLAETLGGQLGLTSTVGVGSRFYVDLPRVSDSQRDGVLLSQGQNAEQIREDSSL